MTYCYRMNNILCGVQRTVQCSVLQSISKYCFLCSIVRYRYGRGYITQCRVQSAQYIVKCIIERILFCCEVFLYNTRSILHGECHIAVFYLEWILYIAVQLRAHGAVHWNIVECPVSVIVDISKDPEPLYMMECRCVSDLV